MAKKPMSIKQLLKTADRWSDELNARKTIKNLRILEQKIGESEIQTLQNRVERLERKVGIGR